MTWRNRRRLALLVLIVGLPAYVVATVSILNALGRPGIVAELLVYVVLGIVWALPLRWLFRGIGQPEPEDERRAREARRH